ncbi:hypothetical protein H4Q26_004493 [Puccinia striiformis f. sp. tritici PST-130]|nr:hypothetical protein H4Q26_004493 [Puccinia striiformis f. sp. tritici PST-130]
MSEAKKQEGGFVQVQLEPKQFQDVHPIKHKGYMVTAGNTGNYFTLELFELRFVMEPHGAYGRIRLFLEDLNLVLGYLPPSIPRPYTNFNFNSLGLQQNSWRRPTHRSRAWKQNRRGNGQERPWDARHPPPHASPTKRSKIHSDSNACVRCYPGGMGPSTSQIRSDTQQLEDYQFHSKRDMDQHRQLEGDCLGFDGDPPVEFAIKTEDVDRMFIHAPYDGQHDEFVEHGNNDYCDTAINENDEDATQLEDHHVVAALLPVNFGSAEPPSDDSQDPSELGELHLETASNRDARSDLGIDVDPAQYDQSCSHSSSASVRSPVLDLVPSTDNCHEPLHLSDPCNQLTIPTTLIAQINISNILATMVIIMIPRTINITLIRTIIRRIMPAILRVNILFMIPAKTITMMGVMMMMMDDYYDDGGDFNDYDDDY